MFAIKHFYWLINFLLIAYGVFPGGVSVVKATGICFWKGGREDWCDIAGLTANR